MFVSQYVCQSVCLCVSMSVCQYVCLCMYNSAYLSLYLLSVYLNI